MKNEIRSQVVESLVEHLRREMEQFLISDKVLPVSAKITLHYKDCTQTIQIDFSEKSL